ncbi:MAG: chemotaxis protein CheW [Anaerolineae bacterium]|nr:chemotaxis protein CheW [Anaerolineae bacterium]
MERQLVVFGVGSEVFGVDIAIVEAIVKMQEITRLPQSADYLEGITNLRGSVLPVINLERRLGLQPSQVTRDTRIMIILLGDNKAGMIVNSVSEVLMVDEAVIETAPALVSSTHTEFVNGIAKIDQRLVLLLDIGKVFAVEASPLLPA